MIRVEICVGSSCHLKGSHGVVMAFQEMIQEYLLDKDVELVASFCNGHCSKGVAMVIDGEPILDVHPENAREVFEEKILKKLRG